MVRDEVGDDLGIGVGLETKAAGFEFAPERLMIFDDPVVHDRDQLTRAHRMRIAFARRAMGGPAGVSDARCPGDGIAGERSAQGIDPPEHTAQEEPFPGDHANPAES